MVASEELSAGRHVKDGKPRENLRALALPSWASRPLLAIVYFGAAKLGLSMAFVHPSVSPVWPPTGIALAAILLLGYRAWPGIMLGAFLANVTTPPETVATAFGISVGNTLEAVLGAFLVRRYVGQESLFEGGLNVAKFVGLAGLLSTAVSATIGTLSLSMGGIAPWAEYGGLWWTWWLGDAGGVIIVAPLLLSWADRTAEWPKRRAVEILCLLALILAIGLVVFSGWLPVGSRHLPLAHLILPLLVWAAFDFNLRGANGALVITAAIAIWGTINGYGPFAVGTKNTSLLLLDSFWGTCALTALILTAEVRERRKAVAARLESDVKLREIVEHATDAIFIKGKDGRHLMVNPFAASLIGRSVAEIIGKRDEELFEPETARQFAEEDRQVLESGVMRMTEVSIPLPAGNASFRLPSIPTRGRAA